MTTALAVQEDPPGVAAGDDSDFLTFYVDGQLFGLPVLTVQDVLDARSLTRIPLAPPEVAGALNLRGRIITGIDVRRRLGLDVRDDGSRTMSIVAEHDCELYNLIVDSVGDVLRLTDDCFESNPATLDPKWREFSQGIYRLKGELLVVLDVDRLLDLRN